MSEQKLDLILSKIESMDAKMESMDSRLGNLETDIKDLKERVTGLEEGQKNLKIELKQDIVTLTEMHVLTQELIKDIEQKLIKQDFTVKSHSAQLRDLTVRVESLETFFVPHSIKQS